MHILLLDNLKNWTSLIVRCPLRGQEFAKKVTVETLTIVQKVQNEYKYAAHFCAYYCFLDDLKEWTSLIAQCPLRDIHMTRKMLSIQSNLLSIGWMRLDRFVILNNFVLIFVDSGGHRASKSPLLFWCITYVQK